MERKAFTIMEMMVAVAIFLIISSILFVILIVGKNSWDVGSTYLTLQQQARRAMTVIANELSQSSSTVVNRYLCNSGQCFGEYIEFQVPVADYDENSPIYGSIYTEEGEIKWGADGIRNNRIRYVVPKQTWSAQYAGQLVRLTDALPEVPEPPSCGDDTCDSGETCSSCPQDCGECPPPACFLAGTPILMADGSIKMIEDIKVGNLVLAFDEENNITVADKVKETMRHKTNKYLLVNNHLKVTAEHPVYSNGEYISIGQLKIGDKLMNKDAQEEEIFDIKEFNEEVVVYNFEVNPYHNYFAGGYLVHNKAQERAPVIPPDVLGFIDRLKLLGLAFAQIDDIEGELGAPDDYEIKVISDNIASLDIERAPGNEAPSNPQTLIITITARKSTTGGMPIELNISSMVKFKNSP